MVARYRLENKMLESKYWEEEERREYVGFVEEKGKCGSMCGRNAGSG